MNNLEKFKKMTIINDENEKVNVNVRIINGENINNENINKVKYI